MKALIIDQVSEHIRPFLEKNGAEVDYVFLPTHDELRDMIGKYDLLVMRVDPRIDKEILDAAVNLKAITIHPARHLGVDDRVGSLEVGKDADIVLTDGNPMVSDTVVRYVIVDGKVLFRG